MQEKPAPLLSLGPRSLALPLIQGGMGVGVSLGRLAGSVAAAGAMGCLSTAGCGYREPDFGRAPEEANLRALRRELARALALSRGEGLVAVNAMVATRQFAQAVRTAVEAGAHAVIAGAGLPLSLPELVPAGRALIAPIVSSARALSILCKAWKSKYARAPDFVVIEGPEAGGHLGFKAQEVLSGACQSLEAILAEVKTVLAALEQEEGKRIPVFCAGGVWDKADIARLQALGADGVQMATRFIATEECDASPAYKNILLAACKEDIRLVRSPVGLPGRAIVSPLLRRLETQRVPPRGCSRCIKNCNPATVRFCITQALIAAVRGNWEEGLFFAGSNAGRLHGITTVPALLRELGFAPLSG